MITASCASLWECPIPLAMTARSRQVVGFAEEVVKLLGGHALRPVQR